MKLYTQLQFIVLTAFVIGLLIGALATLSVFMEVNDGKLGVEYVRDY